MARRRPLAKSVPLDDSNQMTITETQAFFDQRADRCMEESGRAYPKLLQRYYSFLIPPNSRVLELGCGLGDVLAAVKPTRGIGVDFSSATIALARQRHPELEFHVYEAERFSTEEKFDYVILSDLINSVPDVQRVFDHVQRLSFQHTRLVVNFFNNLWRPILACAEQLGCKAPTPPQNWLSTSDVKNLLHLAGWEVIKMDSRILWPIRTPLVASFFNRWLAPLLKDLCLTIFVVARPRPLPSAYRLSSCSVIVPARNEAGNIEAAVLRTPELGSGTEIIFIEGHSRDNTWEEIQRVKAQYPNRNIKALKQQSVGKGGAVREAFAAATGDVLMILDADLTMPPEELPKFYDIIRRGAADFVNGCRLVYPMEHEAMQFLNMVANKFFGLSFSWLLGQPLKDTLCGTKVMFRSDYELLAKNRAYFGDFDPFGDFDLLFGAAKLNLKMLELPIRYCARTYGTTNIQRWRHGLLLFRMLWFAARRFKFFA
jgi:SAM-dependent methyltransferase